MYAKMKLKWHYTISKRNKNSLTVTLIPQLHNGRV